MAVSQEVQYLIKLGADMSAATKGADALKLLKDAFEKLGLTMENTDKISIKSAKNIKDSLGRDLLAVEASVTKANGSIQQIAFSAQKSAKGMEVLDNSLSLVSKSANSASGSGRSLAQVFASMSERALLVAPVWMIIRAALQLLINSIREATKFMIDFQYALAQVKIVGDLTDKDMKKLAVGIVDLGTKFGGNFNEMTDAMILWAQQGKDVNEILTLMEPTIKASIINQRSMKDTVEDLTSVMKSYKLEASQVTEIEDKITKIQLKHAISAKDLSEGLRRLAPAASQYNLSLDQTIGLLTSIQALTRDSGSVAGRGASTILNRLSKPVNVEQVQAISKTKLFFDEAGNETNVVTDKFKNQFQILDAVSKKWDELTTVQKNNIITTIAGTHQYVRGAAVLVNWKEALDVTKESVDSQGASQKAFNELQETTKIKIDELNNSWKALLQTQEGWFNKFAGTVVDGAKRVITGVTLISRTLQSLGDDNIPGETEQQYRARMASKNKVSEDALKDKAKGVSELAKLDKAHEANQQSSLSIQRNLKEQETKLLEEGVSSVAVKMKLRQNLMLKAFKSGFVDDSGGITDPALRSKLKKLTDDISRDSNKETKILALEDEKRIIQDMVALGANDLQIAQQRVSFERERAKITGDNLAVKKAELDLQIQISSEIAKSSKELQSTASSSLSSLLLGKTGGGDFVKSISEKIRGSFAQSNADSLIGGVFQATGIGKVFGGLNQGLSNALNPITNSFVTGANSAAPILANAIVAGAKGASTGTAPGTSGGKDSSGLSSLFKFNNPGAGGLIGAAGLGALGGLSGGPFGNSGSKGSTIGNVAFGAASSIATAINPLLGLAVSTAGSLFSLFKKPKRTTTSEESTQNLQIASRIDITNNKLDIVNRNLVALKNSFDTFVLPESAAFATKSTIEDNFSLNARRGLI